MEKFILTKDNLLLGLFLGLLGPVVGLVIIYFLKFPSWDFGTFLVEFFQSNALITSIGSLCLFTNAVLFTIYINTHRDNTAKGIFVTTVIYGIGILLLKLF